MATRSTKSILALTCFAATVLLAACNREPVKQQNAKLPPPFGPICLEVPRAVFTKGQDTCSKPGAHPADCLKDAMKEFRAGLPADCKIGDLITQLSRQTTDEIYDAYKNETYDAYKAEYKPNPPTVELVFFDLPDRSCEFYACIPNWDEHWELDSKTLLVRDNGSGGCRCRVRLIYQQPHSPSDEVSYTEFYRSIIEKAH